LKSSAKFVGNPWKSLEILGNLWKSLASVGFQWFPLVFRRCPPHFSVLLPPLRPETQVVDQAPIPAAPIFNFMPIFKAHF
jgi:hypothetical protein